MPEVRTDECEAFYAGLTRLAEPVGLEVSLFCALPTLSSAARSDGFFVASYVGLPTRAYLVVAVTVRHPVHGRWQATQRVSQDMLADAVLGAEQVGELVGRRLIDTYQRACEAKAS